MFDLKDLASSLKLLLMKEAEKRLELVFSRLILALMPHSRRLNSGSSRRRGPAGEDEEEGWSIGEKGKGKHYGRVFSSCKVFC